MLFQEIPFYYMQMSYTHRLLDEVTKKKAP